VGFFFFLFILSGNSDRAGVFVGTIETFVREKNVRLFMQIGDRISLRAMTRKVRISPQYGSHLVDVWAEAGLVVRVRSTGKKEVYGLTARGEEIRQVLTGVLGLKTWS